MLDNAALERYSRQILVPGIDLEGQERLAKASVMIVGCGGLGCPLALYLAAAGVGHLQLYDDDTVEASNLPRQIAFTELDVGKPKVDVLADRLRAMNAGIRVDAHRQRFDAAEADRVTTVDLVLDASDSRATRLCIEDVTRHAGKPWIFGASVQMSGQWVAFSPDRHEGCYRCMAPQSGGGASGDCARLGVLGPAVAATAMMQATQALLFLTTGTAPWGRLSIYDFRCAEQQSLYLTRCRECDQYGVS